MHLLLLSLSFTGHTAPLVPPAAGIPAWKSQSMKSQMPETGDYRQHSCSNLSTAYKLEPSRLLPSSNHLAASQTYLATCYCMQAHTESNQTAFKKTWNPHALAPTCKAVVTSAACWGHAETWLRSVWMQEWGGGLPAALLVALFLCVELNSAAAVKSLRFSEWTVWMCEECERKQWPSSSSIQTWVSQQKHIPSFPQHTILIIYKKRKKDQVMI